MPSSPRSGNAAQPAVPKIPRCVGSAATLGVGAIVLAAGGFGIWAGTAELASAVVAQGKVVVASKRKDVQHLDGGIVSTIHVHDGDRVTEGDILVQLDPIKSASRYHLNRTAYFSGLAQQARLQAERDVRGRLDFAPELLEEAARALEIAQLVEAQQRLFGARLAEFQGQNAIWRTKIAVLQQEIEGLQAERTSVSRQLDLANAELAVAENMFKNGHTTRQRVHNIRRECAQLEGSAGRIEAGVNRARKEINEAELSMAQLVMKRETIAVTELRDLDDKLFNYKETYLAAEAELKRLTIRAPVSGTVVASGVHTIGGVVKAGHTILQIVPSSDTLVVEARVRPLDVDNIRNGLETEIRFSGFKQRTTPTVQGRLTSVSADAMADERTNEPYYLASAMIDDGELVLAGLDTKLQPGMPAEIIIKTGQRTAWAYLLQPIHDAMNRAWRED